MLFIFRKFGIFVKNPFLLVESEEVCQHDDVPGSFGRILHP